MKDILTGCCKCCYRSSVKTVFHKDFLPLTNGFVYAEKNNIDNVKQLLNENKCCAIMFEVVQGEGGVLPADPDYLRQLRQLCDEKNILLLFDEVQCGMGRTGHLFAWQGFGVEPDALSLAKAIANAQRDLKDINPALSIVIFDAARPLSVQKEMFEMVKGTEAERFIANPYGEYTGGFHNYGMALDVAIVDNDGCMLDFGTGYDAFDKIAHSGCEAELVKNGLLTMTAYSNRMLLYYVMGKNGMLPYAYEWWHFQLEYNECDKHKYRLLDF